jgi:hypothetical protein
MLEKGEFEDVKHLVGLKINFIRESKSSAASALVSQSHINLLESRLNSKDHDDWRIA